MARVFWAIVLLILVIWLLGALLSLAGKAIHVLLLVVLIVIVARLLLGRERE